MAIFNSYVKLPEGTKFRWIVNVHPLTYEHRSYCNLVSGYPVCKLSGNATIDHVPRLSPWLFRIIVWYVYYKITYNPYITHIIQTYPNHNPIESVGIFHQSKAVYEGPPSGEPHGPGNRVSLVSHRGLSSRIWSIYRLYIYVYIYVCIYMYNNSINNLYIYIY